MNWAAYITVFFVASIKFLFAPSTGIVGFDLAFWETIIVSSIGGIVGVTFFYYTAGFVAEYFRFRRLRKEALLKSQGKEVVRKKIFTPFRRRIVRIKHSFGLIGIAALTPCILSIPIGAVVAARFYHHRRRTIFVLYFFVIAWAFILSFFNDGIVKLLSYISW